MVRTPAGTSGLSSRCHMGGPREGRGAGGGRASYEVEVTV